MDSPLPPSYEQVTAAQHTSSSSPKPKRDKPRQRRNADQDSDSDDDRIIDAPKPEPKPRKVYLAADRPPGLELKSKIVKEEFDGAIQTFDDNLQNVDNLAAFIYQELDNGFKAYVDILGTHVELVTRRDHRHNGRMYTDTVRKTDFKITIDFSSYLEWDRIENHHPTLEMNQILKEYVDSPKKLKILEIKRRVRGDFMTFKSALIQLVKSIRPPGMNQDLVVSFRYEQDRIRVHSPSAIAGMAGDDIVRAFCFITCMWVVFLPLYQLSKRPTEVSLKASYPFSDQLMKEFYDKNAVKIRDAVVGNNPGAFWKAY